MSPRFYTSGSILGKLANLLRPFSRSKDRTITYHSNGRSGHVVYRDLKGALSFYYEFGGGEVVASIQVPDEAHWARETGRAPEERMDILHFIGSRAASEQTTGGSYEITSSWINILEAKKQK